MGKFIQNIAFFGDAVSGKKTEEYKQAYDLAAVLAKKGYTVVDGGGPGVMEAATAGAESVDGNTLTVTFSPKYATGFEDKYKGNHPDVEIETPNYIERIFGLMEHAEVYLMFKGGTGTISEFGLAWVMAKLYKGHHKPFILVGAFWRPIVAAIEENLNIDEDEMAVFKIADTIDEIPEMVEEFEKEMAARPHNHDEAPKDEEAFMV